MNDFIRQTALCIACLISAAAFTVISPFYPAVALRQGIPNWLIGFIFSGFPIASIIVSTFLPSLMFSFGKTPILLSGLIFIGSSNILISFLEDFTPTIAIIFSFLSRILSGIGGSCIFISANTIFSSEYPDKYSKLVAFIEFSVGFGLILGPAIGSFLFTLGGFKISCSIFGLIVYLCIPFMYLLLGKSKPYIISDKSDTGMLSLMKKPKIFIHSFMPFLYMLNTGFSLPTLEIHLLSYDVKEKNIGYWQIIYTIGMMIGSFLLSTNYKVKKPYIMAFGILLSGIGWNLIGPNPLITRNFVLVCIGLHVLGWGGSMTYIPSIPYMIESAHTDYGYEEDHRVNDAIASISNISFGMGEIAGPIFGSLLSIYLSLETAYMILGFFLFTFFVFYSLSLVAFKPKTDSKTLLSPFQIELN